jgi:hypothetical protein
MSYVRLGPSKKSPSNNKKKEKKQQQQQRQIWNTKLYLKERTLNFPV